MENVAPILALLAALLFGSSFILVRKGLTASSPHSASIVSFGVATVYFWALSITFDRIPNPDPTGVLLFAVSGIFAPGFIRWLRLMSFEKIGVPISTAITGSAPLFVIFWAALLLQEKVTAGIIVGAILVTTGITVLQERIEWRAIFQRGVIYAIGSAFSVGVAATVRKMGLLLVNAPLLAGAVGSTASLVVFSVLLPASHVSLTLNRQSLRFFIGSAVLEAFAMTSLFFAYSVGSVMVVESLVSTTPLIAIFLSIIFLKGIDRVSQSTVLGAGLIVAGAILIIAGFY